MLNFVPHASFREIARVYGGDKEILRPTVRLRLGKDFFKKWKLYISDLFLKIGNVWGIFWTVRDRAVATGKVGKAEGIEKRLKIDFINFIYITSKIFWKDVSGWIVRGVTCLERKITINSKKIGAI